MIWPRKPNPEAQDMASELKFLVREIAAHEASGARFFAAYALLEHLNTRRDHYGLILAVDTSRQTLEHFSELPEGIVLAKDRFGAAVGLEIGPHFPNEWQLLALSRTVTEIADPDARFAALSQIVRETLSKGETRCWELQPVLTAHQSDPVDVLEPRALLRSDAVIAEIAQLVCDDVSVEGVRRTIEALVTVIERGTETCRVELANLGTFKAEVRPNGNVVLVFEASD